MIRSIALLAVISPTLAIAEPEVRAAGVQLVWEDNSEAFDGFGLFNTQHPLTLGLVVDAGGASMIEFDEDASKLIALRDDLGSKLEGEFGSFPKISEDGKLLRFELRSDERPKPGASQLQAKGEVVVIAASESETIESEVVTLEEGAKLSLGDRLEFKLTKVGKPDWGDAELQLDLEIKRDIPELAALRFYDADGEEIESDRLGSSRMGFMNQVTVTRSYSLAKKVDAVRIEADVWTDLEEITVPFDVSVGIGGPIGD